MDQNDLLARLTALEATVETLQRQLGQRSSTMKRTLRCSCGGTRILQFFRIFEIGHNQRYELSLVSRISVWTGAKTSAPLEVYVCRSCRLVEWHAKL